MRSRVWNDILKMSLLDRELVWNHDKQLFHGPIAEIHAEGDTIGIRCTYAEARVPQNRTWTRLFDVSPIVALRSRFQTPRIASDGMIRFEIIGIGEFAILPKYARIAAKTGDPFAQDVLQRSRVRREMLWDEIFRLPLTGCTVIRAVSGGDMRRAIIRAVFKSDAAATIHLKDVQVFDARIHDFVFVKRRNDELRIHFDEEPKLPIMEANGTILLILRSGLFTIHPLDDHLEAG